jgi:hypothetical protein
MSWWSQRRRWLIRRATGAEGVSVTAAASLEAVRAALREQGEQSLTPAGAPGAPIWLSPPLQQTGTGISRVSSRTALSRRKIIDKDHRVVGQFVCRLTLSKANSDRIKAKSRTTSRAGSERLRPRNDSSFGPLKSRSRGQLYYNETRTHFCTNANSLCGQKSAGSRESVRPFKGIFCDDVSEIAVGTLITERPPHRTERAPFGHSAPTSGI